jgi:Protein of unknown function (DUF2934)
VRIITVYVGWMKHHNFSQDQNQKPVNATRMTATLDSKQSAIDFAPSADEVAKRAYFSFLNQGSPRGHDVQHWLKAEAELIAERNLTRAHGFHNKS